MRNQVSISDTENRARKANLAKLLATENISVVHKNIPTAYFDVQNRVLGLPNWDNASKDVFDLLVGHEVGHALYTPNDAIEDFINEVDSANAGAVHSFINVIEDARIERKIKRKFAGLRKNFYNGYKELLERDFFGLKDRDILSFSLIDRINIHYKVGSLFFPRALLGTDPMGHSRRAPVVASGDSEEGHHYMSLNVTATSWSI